MNTRREGHGNLRVCGTCLKIVFVLAVFISSALFGTGAAKAAGLAARIQAAYSRIRDASGSFVQKSYLKDLGKTETFGGDFMIKLPARMRYIYKTGSLDQVVIRGDAITIYQEKEDQVLKSRFDPGTYGTAPVAFLGGLGDIDRDFNVTEKNGELILRPKNPMSGIEFITVRPSNGAFPVKSFSIHDRYSNVVRIILKDVRLNRGIKDSVFDFIPPPGAHVFDYTR
ncbi:MAG: outer membrane lipoprotein carrier protein LolA [Nitrospiraceae bacterium]|nr:outer membrane lipoprotein carrier protein LolA [Nitrospiraceae bacterium]